MLVSEKVLKWIIRFYPPLFFQRIWVKSFAKDFKGVSVSISKSILNINPNRSIFGGTSFAAADPFYPLLFDRIFKQKGYKTIIWIKSAQVQYLKPGDTCLHFNINIDDDTISEAEQALNTGEGKYIKTFLIEIFNTHNELCVTVNMEVYIRNLNFKTVGDESNHE